MGGERGDAQVPAQEEATRRALTTETQFMEEPHDEMGGATPWGYPFSYRTQERATSGTPKTRNTRKRGQPE